MGLFGKKKQDVHGDADAPVLILGGGCAKCNELEGAVRQALAELGLQDEVGHGTDFTQIAAYGGMFCITKKLWVRVVCMALALLIPFSRLYLGVHMPLDVGVSFLIGWLLVLAFYPLLEEIGHRGEVLERIWLILLVPAALFLLYALRVRAGASGDAANFDHAVKTAWTMLGLVLGAIVSVFADRHYTRFETQAVWWAQILKVVLGLALTLAGRVALKAPLTAAFGANSVGDGIRYFAVVLMAGTLWPMTFGWFSLMGRKK